jgi:hypothetical protein
MVLREKKIMIGIKSKKHPVISIKGEKILSEFHLFHWTFDRRKAKERQQKWQSWEGGGGPGADSGASKLACAANRVVYQDQEHWREKLRILTKSAVDED